MRRLRILIVEDDAMVSMVLAEIFVGLHHEICGIATTESDAVSAAARCKPDMMINRRHVAGRKRRGCPGDDLRSGPIPQILMNGAGPQSDAVMLRKPFREADLVRAMERALATAAVA